MFYCDLGSNFLARADGYLYYRDLLIFPGPMVQPMVALYYCDFGSFFFFRSRDTTFVSNFVSACRAATYNTLVIFD